jgi:hypothetical protein
MLDAIGHRIQPLLGIRQSALKDEAGYAVHVVALTLPTIALLQPHQRLLPDNDPRPVVGTLKR